MKIHMFLKLVMLKAGFLNLSTTDILGWIIRGCGGCPIHYRIFNSIPSLTPLDANSISPPPLVITKNVPRHCHRSTGVGVGVQNHSQLRTPALWVQTSYPTANASVGEHVSVVLSFAIPAWQDSGRYLQHGAPSSLSAMAQLHRGLWLQDHV